MTGQATVATILLIDDQPAFREPIAAILRSRGHTVLCAPDGETAMRVVEGQPLDLILLDVVIPRLDGFGFLGRLRRSERCKEIPVILVTAMAKREVMAQAKGLHFQGYLLKSAFSVEQLLGQVETCLTAGSATCVRAAV